MKRRHLSRTTHALAVLASAGVVSCATEPADPRVGTYGLTTTLETFTFETSAPSPPDCPNPITYCTHSRPANGATLSGTLTIHSVTPASSPSGQSSDIHGEFSGRFCDTIDYPTGCSSLAAVALSYTSGLLVGTGGDVEVYLVGGTQLDSHHLNLTKATFDGDKIAGSVYWSLHTGRSPPAYWGTFIARRRR